MGKNSIQFHFGHMGFIEKTNCKLPICNDSTNALSSYKIERICLLTLHFAADFPLQLNDLITNYLLWDRMAGS